MSKKSKSQVPVQKGSISLNNPDYTLLMKTSEEKVREDARNDFERRDGQMLKLHTPKK